MTELVSHISIVLQYLYLHLSLYDISIQRLHRSLEYIVNDDGMILLPIFFMFATRFSSVA